MATKTSTVENLGAIEEVSGLTLFLSWNGAGATYPVRFTPLRPNDDDGGGAVAGRAAAGLLFAA